MQQINTAMTALYVWLTVPRERSERGDIPGWVLVTVMTAGIVAAIWSFAGGQLRTMLETALAEVKK